jgi:hypothetical protein
VQALNSAGSHGPTADESMHAASEDDNNNGSNSIGNNNNYNGLAGDQLASSSRATRRPILSPLPALTPRSELKMQHNGGVEALPGSSLPAASLLSPKGGSSPRFSRFMNVEIEAYVAHTPKGIFTPKGSNRIADLSMDSTGARSPNTTGARSPNTTGARSPNTGMLSPKTSQSVGANAVTTDMRTNSGTGTLAVGTCGALVSGDVGSTPRQRMKALPGLQLMDVESTTTVVP